MKEGHEKYFISGFIILATLYNYMVFTMFFGANATFWTPYFFTMLAFAFQIGGLFIAHKRDGTIDDVFFGLPITYISIIYLLIQITTGTIAMAFPRTNSSITNLLQVAILAFYMLLVVLSFSARKTVQTLETDTGEKVFLIKSLTADVEDLFTGVADEDVKKGLLRLRDIIKYSDPISHPNLKTLEQTILDKTDELVYRAKSGDCKTCVRVIHEIERLFAQRNQRCKLLKA